MNLAPDTQEPEYSYIAGDIAKAYGSNVKEAVRSMLFMPLEDEEHPAAFVVFDQVTTENKDAKRPSCCICRKSRK